MQKPNRTSLIWTDKLDFEFIKSPPMIFGLGLFFVFTLFQIMPLPAGFLKYLNPFQHQVVEHSSVLLGEISPWHSLSYVPSASFARWIFLISLFLFFWMLRSEIKRLKIYLSSDRIGFQLSVISILLFILLALLFSKSRAGITGAFIGFIAFVMLCHLGGKKLSKPVWITMGMGILFLLFYGSAIGFEQLIGRFLAIEGHAGSRMNIWKDTIAMIKGHPFGIGLGNYEYVMPVFNAHGPYGTSFAHAHNDYLQLLAEAGWPGFIALVGGFYLFLGKSVLMIRRFGPKMNPERFYITVGAISGLISMAFHSFFDFNLQIPANMLYFVVLMAIVISNEQRAMWRQG